MEYPYRKCAAAVLFNDSGRVLVCARNDLQHDEVRRVINQTLDIRLVPRKDK